MIVTLATVNLYNARRYGTPWACVVVDGKNNFIHGAYNGDDDGGAIMIEDPQNDQVYGFGQHDSRSNSSATYYVIWNGTAFEYCDRKGNTVDTDHYARMRHDNRIIVPCLDVQVEASIKEDKMAELVSIEEAVRTYEALSNKLSPRIMLDRETGEVWISELVSENDQNIYCDDSVADITAEALEEQMDQTEAVYEDDLYNSGPMTPLADAIRVVAHRMCDAWTKETA